MIIDFNKGNGGGMPSSALTNYWDSAVTEEHIESASSIVYDSAKTYTDQAVSGLASEEYVQEALSGVDLTNYWTSAETETQIEDATKDFVTSAQTKEQIEGYNYVNSGDVKSQVEAYGYITGVDLTNYWTSAETEEHIESASSIVYASAASYTDQAVAGIDLSDYYTSAQTEEAITSKNYVNSGQVKDQVETYEYVESSSFDSMTGKYLYDNGYKDDNYNEAKYTTSAQVETQITDKHYVNSGDVKDQVEAYGYITGVDLSDYWTSAQTEEAMADFVTSADVKTQVEVYNYITSAETKTQIEDYHYVNSADVKTQVEAYEYVNSGQVESQILAKNYLTAEDIEPDLIYSGNPGFYAVNSSALTTWQLENLDLSNYNFVRFYVKAADIDFNDSDNFTAPLYVDVQLDPKSLSSQYQVYMGVTSNICAGNRNRSYHVIAAVDITKSKVQLLYQTTLWDISTSNANNNGRYCYKIEGYRYNVCGAAENGGGGEAYTAGANINISPVNVISVSGLSTINGSAITGGGNLVIQGGGDMSAYYTSAQTEQAITSKNYVTSAQVETQIESKDYVAGSGISFIIKLYQSEYDELVNNGQISNTTLYIIVSGSPAPVVPLYTVSVTDANGGTSADTYSNGQIPFGEYQNKNIVSVVIGSGITTIGGYAFCDNGDTLSAVTIGPDVEVIEGQAFQHAPISSITIPASVTEIGENAFNAPIGEMIFEGTVPPYLSNDDANLGGGIYDDCPIYVPDSAVNVYKSEYTGYAYRIHSINDR